MMKCVLFDVDGVLVDSADLWSGVWTDWAQLRQVDLTRMLTGIHGERGIDTIARMTPHLVPEEELALLVEMAFEHEHTAVAYPAAAELLSRYHDRCGLVTSGPRTGTLARFERLGLRVPDVVVCGEDVEHGKPHPEPFRLGCERLGVAPRDCVVVEDAPAGIAAARAAGCHVLALMTSVGADQCAAADEILVDLSAAADRLDVLLSG